MNLANAQRSLRLTRLELFFVAVQKGTKSAASADVAVITVARLGAAIWATGDS